MSTHSSITVKLAKDAYFGVYCHFDGYLSGVGQTLLSNYTDLEKVIALIELGDLEVLGSTLNSPSKFLTKNHEATVAFARDRGEELHKPIAESTWELVIDNIDGEHNYLFEDGKWYWKYGDKAKKELTQELINKLDKKY